MVLDAEGRAVGQRDAAVRAVEERDMGLDRIRRQARRIDREAVVHRDDLDLAGGLVLHRVVRAVMALLHLHGLTADGERHHLVSQTDAEGRDLLLKQFLDDRNGIFAGGGRVARAVGEEDAIGIERQDVLGGRGRGHDGDVAAGLGEQAQDVALHAVVDGDDLELVALALAVAGRPDPGGLVPVVAL